MSPRKLDRHVPERVALEIRRGGIGFGQRVRDARLARRWTVIQLADRAGLSPDMIYRVENGHAGSPESCARIAVALGRRIETQLIDPRRRADRPDRQDVVHSAMGELEAAQLRRHGLAVGMDEPYQHYQFAGRADLVAWDLAPRALLHIENRTRFADFQEMAGAYNAKRAYLGPALAQRLGAHPWHSETHVIVALWSAEVLHALRLRAESFRALCPDPAEAFSSWWIGTPTRRGKASTLVVLDPLASGRQRPFIGLEEALSPSTRPRHRDYADVAARLAAPP
jgi:transcriptional regulator with XRE-family HTH domain